MIVAAVDDLLFSSRIRNAARQAGVECVFARSAEAVVDQVRTRRPALVLFDLDAERIRPLDALAGLRADPELAGTPTLGFVSHVHAGLIQAARAGGMGDVLPRSAFVAALPDIVASAK